MHLDEVRAAQKLRYDVFVNEFGANLCSAHQVGKSYSTAKQEESSLHTFLKIDQDEFDDYCEHLFVKEVQSGQVVGTYRVLPPLQAKRIGRLYTENEFDISTLQRERKKMVELGRSCVHPDHRGGAVIMALGSALFQFMHLNRFDSMVGCASIPIQSPGLKNGEAASAIWHRLKRMTWLQKLIGSKLIVLYHCRRTEMIEV